MLCHCVEPPFRYPYFWVDDGDVAYYRGTQKGTSSVLSVAAKHSIVVKPWHVRGHSNAIDAVEVLMTD